MKARRTVFGALATLVATSSLVVVPVAFADPNSPPPKESGEHNAYTYCHRTGSLSNPWVIITTDDAAWAEAHHAGSVPGHPPLNGNDDILLGINVADPKAFTDADCDKKVPPDPK